MVSLPLRIVLGLVGLSIAVLGLDSALGGLDTLGMQVPRGFADTIDAEAYRIRDNHVRFLGGVWVGLGLLWIAGAVQPLRFRIAILASIGMILVGALARLSAPDLGEVLQSPVASSLAFELLVFPAIGYFFSGRPALSRARGRSNRRRLPSGTSCAPIAPRAFRRRY
ncbi:DUF4345 domain-containing protein [Sphingoaurantiacus capsulatus]|uniref:DUF4345 domain-containing protein n=1 Tax=Sphingoaurantiacus capsulatus TaxID=1771310 RepID=A0ABV7X947_9SPHN